MTAHQSLNIALLSLITLALFSTPAEATQRSYWAKAEFKRQHPCPANGRTKGRCPGWQIDHRIPLKCGGPDIPSNMQWLTIAEHQDKTSREAHLCRSRIRRMQTLKDPVSCLQFSQAIVDLWISLFTMSASLIYSEERIIPL